MDRILVAEDDESIREELKTLLRANGYRTVDEPPCELALLDVNLPNESGFRTLPQTADAVERTRHLFDGAFLRGG